MDTEKPGPSKGYQKVKKDEKPFPSPSPKPKAGGAAAYSSPTAKKWPQLVTALEAGNVDRVNELIEEGVNVNLVRNGVTPLMIAVSKNRVETAGAVLQAGVNINERDDDGWTALHKASWDQAGPEVVELLLKSGIDVGAKNRAGKTALELAEEKGHRDIVRAISRHQEQIRIDEQEWEAFLGTPEGKPYKMRRRFDSLEAYSNLLWLPPVALGGAGLVLGLLLGSVVPAALSGAAFGALCDALFAFLKNRTGAYLDDIGLLPELDIHLLRSKRAAGEPAGIPDRKTSAPAEPVVTAEQDPEPAVTAEQGPKSAVTAEQSPKLESRTALKNHVIDDRRTRTVGISRRPAERKSPRIRVFVSAALVLVLTGAAVSAFLYRDRIMTFYYAQRAASKGITLSGSALIAGAARDDLKAVDLLIAAGIPLDGTNGGGQTALAIAAERGCAEIAGRLAGLDKSLLRRVDRRGSTALMTAARRGNRPIVALLADKGAEVNFTVLTETGAATALEAVLDSSDFGNAHLGIVRDLLKRGADARVHNAAGRFPLLFAAEYGRMDAARMLIEHGADVHDKDRAGRTALMTAACKGDAGLVTLLADSGAEVGRPSPDGQTPLMCAAREGHVEAVQVLLEKGADVNARTAEGATALDEAAGAGSVAVVRLLLAHGADPAKNLSNAVLDLKGRRVDIRARRQNLDSVLKRIGVAAARDGYRIITDGRRNPRTTLRTRGPWNAVLADLAKRNRLVLVVKEREVHVLSY